MPAHGARLEEFVKGGVTPGRAEPSYNNPVRVSRRYKRYPCHFAASSRNNACGVLPAKEKHGVLKKKLQW
jgi:hypothetical protein